MNLSEQEKSQIERTKYHLIKAMLEIAAARELVNNTAIKEMDNFLKEYEENLILMVTAIKDDLHI